MKIDAIIVAAGRSERFKSGRKQFAVIDGKPLVFHTIMNFVNAPEIDKVITVLPADSFDSDSAELAALCSSVEYVRGGSQRPDSVINGLKASNADFVLVHDGARPLADGKLISRVCNSLSKGTCVIPCMKPSDTVRLMGEGASRVFNRDNVCLVQTPQGADRSELLKIMKENTEKGVYMTDEAQYIESSGGTVTVIEGDSRNIKVTFENDMDFIRSFIRR